MLGKCTKVSSSALPMYAACGKADNAHEYQSLRETNGPVPRGKDEFARSRITSPCVFASRFT